MTKLIKRKGLLFLMTIAVMVAMISVACKNRTTQPADFNVANLDDNINQTGTLAPSDTITIDTKRGIIQYGGAYFESEEYKNPDGTKFRYAVKFEEINDQQFGKIVLVKFTGYDKNGVKIDKTYTGGSAKKSGAEKQEYAPYQFGLMESSDLIIYATGYLDFKPKGFETHIKLALKSK